VCATGEPVPRPPSRREPRACRLPIRRRARPPRRRVTAAGPTVSSTMAARWKHARASAPRASPPSRLSCGSKTSRQGEKQGRASVSAWHAESIGALRRASAAEHSHAARPPHPRRARRQAPRWASRVLLSRACLPSRGPLPRWTVPPRRARFKCAGEGGVGLCSARRVTSWYKADPCSARPSPFVAALPARADPPDKMPDPQARQAALSTPHRRTRRHSGLSLTGCSVRTEPARTMLR
jgi:hypothetical protein